MSTNRTRHLLLSYLGRGDKVSDDDWKVLGRDRDTIDTAIWAALKHTHIGGEQDGITPQNGLLLTLDQTQGVLPAATFIYYKYTLLDARGVESLPCAEATIRTPNAIAPPTAPTTQIDPAGGSLLPGDYSYVLSAYKGANTLETQAVNVQRVLLPAGSVHYRVILTLPPLPAGAEGFNLYRRSPGNNGYHHLAAIDMNVATPPTSYVDDGTVAEDCDRSLSPKNRTNAQNAIIVTLPGATPTVPIGYTWKLYRATVPAHYSNSLVHHVVEETSEGSGIIRPNWIDVGYQTTAGQPPTEQLTIPNPDKIRLTDSLEVTGRLPMGRTTFPVLIPFEFPGDVVVGLSRGVWLCEYPELTVISARVCTGRGLVSLGDVTVDVLLGDDSATPAYASLWDDPDDRPKLLAGDQNGSRVEPDHRAVTIGESLVVDIVEIDGATPSAQYITVWVYAIAHGYPNVSFVDDTTTGA